MREKERKKEKRRRIGVVIIPDDRAIQLNNKKAQNAQATPVGRTSNSSIIAFVSTSTHTPCIQSLVGGVGDWDKLPKPALGRK